MPDLSASAAIGGVTYIAMPFELISGQQAWTMIEFDELARTYFAKTTPLNLEEVGRHRYDPNVPAAVLAGPELHEELRATAAEAERELRRTTGGFQITVDRYLPRDGGAIVAYTGGDAPAGVRGPADDDSLARGVSFGRTEEMAAGTWGVTLKPDGYEQPFQATDFTPELVASLALNGIRAFDLAPDVYNGNPPYLSAPEMMERLQEIPASSPFNDGVSWIGEINGCDVMAADWLEDGQWLVEGQRLGDLSVRALMATLLLDARKPDVAVPGYYAPILTQLAETHILEWSKRKGDLEGWAKMTAYLDSSEEPLDRRPSGRNLRAVIFFRGRCG
jgi:hypothetical protein